MPCKYFGTFFLTFNSTVTNLKVFGVVFRTEDINLLTHALRINTSLSSLDLGCNSIGHEGANSLAQAPGLNSPALFLLSLWLVMALVLREQILLIRPSE